METKKVFDDFLNELKTINPNITISEYNVDTEVKSIESSYYPEVLKILQKDETFFSTSRIFCNINISDIWLENESSREMIWKNLQMCMFSSFLHGDMKEKMSTLLSTVKSLWSQSDQSNDEITKILNDENAEDHFKEILDYLQETRLAKLFTSLVESINLDEFVDDLDFENPTQIFEMFKNPEHPTMKKMINKVKDEVEKRVQRGELTQNQIIAEVEGIKQKIQSIFGNVVNEMLGGRRGETPSSVLIGNSPEARRQRMLARLQKKQRNKNSY